MRHACSQNKNAEWVKSTRRSKKERRYEVSIKQHEVPDKGNSGTSSRRSRIRRQAGALKRCFIWVRNLPLERFRLDTDGRKWRQAARSRKQLLMYFASFANADGTFCNPEKSIDYSPSAKKALQHFSKHSFYRLSGELHELRLLSWDRELTYGRRAYRIHIDSPGPPGASSQHVSHSPNHVPHSGKHVSDSQKHVPPAAQGTGSMMENNPPLQPFPTEKQNHQSEIDKDRFDDKDPSKANFRDELHPSLQSKPSVKVIAFESLQEKYPDCDPGYLWATLELIEQRAANAGSAPKSAKYYGSSVENEFKMFGYTKTTSEPSQVVEPFQRAEEHVENCLRAFDDAVAKFPGIAEGLAQIKTKIADNLRGVRENLKSVEILGQILDDTDFEIFQILKAISTQDELDRLSQDPELLVYKARLSPAAFAQTKGQYYRRRLLEKYGLPRFGLYYMPDH
jgi:hypothetical protein